MTDETIFIIKKYADFIIDDLIELYRMSYINAQNIGETKIVFDKE